MKIIKIILTLLLVWPKFLVYDPIRKGVYKKWEEGEKKPVKYWKKVRWFKFLESFGKFLAIILAIIPLGPISMIATWLLIRGGYEKTIAYEEEHLSSEVEDFKEELRNRRKNIIDLVKESGEDENNINWSKVDLFSEEAIKLNFKISEILYKDKTKIDAKKILKDVYGIDLDENDSEDDEFKRFQENLPPLSPEDEAEDQEPELDSYDGENELEESIEKEK